MRLDISYGHMRAHETNADEHRPKLDSVFFLSFSQSLCLSLSIDALFLILSLHFTSLHRLTMCATNTVLPGGYVILACCQKVEMMLSKTAIIFIWFHLYFTLHLFFIRVLRLYILCGRFFLNILKGIPLKSRLKSNHLAYYDDPRKLRAFPLRINNAMKKSTTATNSYGEWKKSTQTKKNRRRKTKQQNLIPLKRRRKEWYI